jgi:hypothetical protein
MRNHPTPLRTLASRRPTSARPTPARLLALLAFALTGLALVACGNSTPEATPTPEVSDTTGATSTDTGTRSTDPASPTFDFPTLDPVLVSADFIPSQSQVDNTGLGLPANGKPTLVFVDAIW